jgi:1,4-alpha-glucan branching enzyme
VNLPAPASQGRGSAAATATAARASSDAFALVLHTHIPYVLGHGTWPHGSEWLLEAAADCYLPLLAEIDRLAARGLRPGWTIALSPVLAEQLADPRFDHELRLYLGRKRDAAAEDARAFGAGAPDRARQAAVWRDHFDALLHAYVEDHRGDLAGAFRRREASGAVELMTCAATHGYLPLLGTAAAVAAQLRTAVASHTRLFGHAPRGIWLPECAYRPGLEAALAAQGLRHFVVDAHLFGAAVPAPSPYLVFAGAAAPRLVAWKEPHEAPPATVKLDAYDPADVGDAHDEGARARAFARHAEAARRVWSADEGYPGDPAYLDFHKKHHPGGHRYWRVTGPRVDMGKKADYEPAAAAARARAHAEHFAGLVQAELAAHRAAGGHAGTVCAPFDTELFGHWWFEGVAFLGALVEELDRRGVVMATLEEREADHAASGTTQPAAALPEGSWGLGGDHRVWANAEVQWVWDLIRPGERDAAELAAREEAATNGSPEAELARRARRQHARALLLLEASDWPFLMTVGTAADYAERRVRVHAADRERLARLARDAERGPLSDADRDFLGALEARDRLFPDVDPRWWR